MDRTDRRLNGNKDTWSPLGFLPALWQPSLECSQISIFVDVVLAILKSLEVASFSIGRRRGLEDLSINRIQFLLELFDTIVYGLLDYYFRLLG